MTYLNYLQVYLTGPQIAALLALRGLFALAWLMAGMIALALVQWAIMGWFHLPATLLATGGAALVYVGNRFAALNEHAMRHRSDITKWAAALRRRSHIHMAASGSVLASIGIRPCGVARTLKLPPEVCWR